MGRILTEVPMPRIPPHSDAVTITQCRHYSLLRLGEPLLCTKLINHLRHSTRNASSVAAAGEIARAAGHEFMQYLLQFLGLASARVAITSLSRWSCLTEIHVMNDDEYPVQRQLTRTLSNGSP